MASDDSDETEKQSKRGYFRRITTNAFHRQSEAFYEHPIVRVSSNIKREYIVTTTTNQSKCKILKRNDFEQQENVVMDSHVSAIDDDISISSLFDCTFKTDTLMISSNQRDPVNRLGLSAYSPTITVIRSSNQRRPSTTKFKHQQAFSLLTLHLKSVWILLTDDLKFNGLTGNGNVNMIAFDCGYYMNLCYGALTTMNKFLCYSETYFYQKKSPWKLFFGRDRFEIIMVDYGSQTIHAFKKVITKEHITPGAIIDISENGFVVYICIKGNPAEYVKKKGSNERYCRVYNPEVQPQMSTLRLTVCTKNILGKKLRIVDTAARNVKQTLENFISFFQSNKIPVYFASIQFNRSESIVNYQQHKERFRTFIQSYSYKMLLTIGGCRLQQKMTYYVIQQLLALENNDELFYYVCLRLIRYASKNYFLDDIANEIKNILEYYNEFYIHSLFYQLEKSFEMIPHIVITPTIIKFYPFKFAKSNRVLRATDKFGGIQNFAVVEFRDDNGTQLQTRNFSDVIQLFDNYLDKEHGLQIGDRVYIYFHHAQSQLKQKQFYFYYHDEQKGFLSVEDGYAWMGDFTSIRVPARYAARMSQCFSTTEATIRIPAEAVLYIRDLLSSDGKYIFSDGVGRISSRLIKKIHDYMGWEGAISNVIQIRYGGCKGTLVCDPSLDEEEKQVLIRDSMRKFNSEDDTLEICKRSIPRPVYLNRQTIILLSNRLIGDSIFFILQLKNILWLIKSLISTAPAIKLMHEKVLRVFPLEELSKHPALYNEPFFQQLVSTTCRNVIFTLKNRAHIPIDIFKGRYMFGIVDEYGILKPGQAFVQYTNMNDRTATTTLNNQKVVVSKNPCHHPGDLRTFEAVDVPQLRHLTDCIIFPQHGSRPHPHEIAGSDLDGDEYTVIWDQDLVPLLTGNFEPYEYDSDIKPIKLDRPIIRKDIKDIILSICQQDNLGRLSKMHLAYVDKFGVIDSRSKDLAAGISKELDSVKNGYHPYTEAQITDLQNELGITRPDYTEYDNYESYPSKHILGKLYRSVNRFLPTFKTINHDVIKYDKAFIYGNWQNYIVEATALFKSYQSELFEIIYAHNFDNEIDLFCCCESQNINNNDRSEIQATAQQLLSKLFKYILEKFNNELDASHLKADCVCSQCQQQMAKASACYIICYLEVNRSNDNKKRILSFPWIFTSWLIKMKKITHNDEEQLEKHLYSIPMKFKIYSKYYSSNESFVYMKNNLTKQYQIIIVSYERIKFIEIIHNWLHQQEIFGNKYDECSPKPVIPNSCWEEIKTKFISSSVMNNNIHDNPHQWNVVFEKEKQTSYRINYKINNEDYYPMYYELLDICFADTIARDDIHLALLSDYIMQGFLNMTLEH
ncbi:unnamed protein product [Didymodactylos carnosus]|uniref:RNA-dependent RNA polymerase n=1 Tax=Didymodactylos carnosus TaxID=1234261 RepID=A0A814FU10_9BILA|nr:unnamed protein product [Didymodactylos carnosus]CAF3760492.1 unnamed protein product [Didymodactylos carnosus]